MISDTAGKTAPEQSLGERVVPMKVLEITMPDGSVWGVPVDVIARNRAENYAGEFGDDVGRSLAEDTGPLFDEDDYEIQDWAANNMNWDDVAAHATKLREPPAPDYQEGWVNGEKRVVEA